MKDQHLNEELLQQHLMEGIPLDSPARLHLETCSLCRQNLEAYRLVIKGLAVQEEPAFDFDLAAAVMAKLPAQKPACDKTFIWMIVAVIFVLAAALTASVQLDFSFMQFSKGPVLTGLMLITGLGSLVFFLVSSWQDFHKKISLLDGSQLQHKSPTTV